MKKLYEKNELTFAIVWIVIYCVLQSLANSFNEIIGIDFSANAVLCILQTIILFAFIKKNNLMERYGLCKSSIPASRFLYYIPLIIFASGNLWNGIAVNYPWADAICRVVCMLCVGFVEELIFRGFLFEAIAKEENVKRAIIISSMTFGIGHIINLVNGSGMELTETLCQIIFAIAVGFLFVTLYYRGGSLLPCIIAHSVNNSLGTFSNEAGYAPEQQMAHLVSMIAITVSYTLVLTKTLPEKQYANINSEADN